MAVVKIGLPYPAPGNTMSRFGKTDMVVPYTIDGVGSFMVRIPAEEYNPSLGEQKVREQAAGQVALKDKEIQL
jgi:hypothetical protein